MDEDPIRTSCDWNLIKRLGELVQTKKPGDPDTVLREAIKKLAPEEQPARIHG